MPNGRADSPSREVCERWWAYIRRVGDEIAVKDFDVTVSPAALDALISEDLTTSAPVGPGAPRIILSSPNSVEDRSLVRDLGAVAGDQGRLEAQQHLASRQVPFVPGWRSRSQGANRLKRTSSR